jgi:hypothetical protein
VEEPAYATLFVFPLLFAAGEPPPVVSLGFTLATDILGILNMFYQRFTVDGPVVRFEALRSILVLIGVILGVPPVGKRGDYHEDGLLHLIDHSASWERLKRWRDAKST